MLTARQNSLYAHTCDLWKPTQSINATTGKPSGYTFSLAYSGVKMLYQYTPNISDPDPVIGDVKRATLFTDDSLHFDAAQEVGERWLAVNRSTLPQGGRSPLYGECHRILGASNTVPNAGRRRANKQSFLAQVLEHPPSEVII